MTSLRRFTCDDLLRFANINLDQWTETYNFAFYMTYMARWPELFTLAQSPSGRPMGYSARARSLSTLKNLPPLHGCVRVRARMYTHTHSYIPSAGEVMGKVEGKVEQQKWHGHVTAVTVAPEFRRLGLAKQLMGLLEWQSEHIHNGFFVDLFVRQSNATAIAMYTALGYTTYRRVLEYYSGEEDALDLRKALPRDTERRSIIPLPHPVRADEETD